jgi:uncharacterized protein (TIGR02594 family)
VTTTPLAILKRYVRVHEDPRKGYDHPFIQWCLSLCGLDPESPDEVAWCSAFIQHAAFELGLERTGSAAARSWLTVGQPVKLLEAQPGFDVVVLSRGTWRPGPEVIKAPGHVAMFVKVHGERVWVWGGNQGNGVSLAAFPVNDILGIRRLRPVTEG